MDVASSSVGKMQTLVIGLFTVPSAVRIITTLEMLLFPGCNSRIHLKRNFSG